MPSAITRAFDALEYILSGIVITLLAAMVVLIGSQVAARYVVGVPLYWSEELARHLMIWLFFLGAVIALRRGAHLSIDLLPESLPPRGTVMLRGAVLLILGTFLTMMTWYGWDLAQRTMVQRASALHYPMGYVYAALPISGFLMLLVTLERLAASITAYRAEQASAGS